MTEVFRIALQTLRSRPGALAGAFLAIFLAVTFAHASGLLMAGALQDPGPGRLATADLVIRTDPTVRVAPDAFEEIIPAPPVDSEALAVAAATDGVEKASADSSFAVGLFDAAGAGIQLSGADHAAGHSWSAAALTPYKLRAGEPPQADDEVVVDSRVGASVGDRVVVAGTGAEIEAHVVGVSRSAVDENGDQAAVFFTDAAARLVSGSANLESAIVIAAEPDASLSALTSRLETSLGPQFEVLDRSEAAFADPGDPREAGRDTVVAIFGTMAGIAGGIALFVVSGTFALALAQRRKEMAVMRALGATPRQVRSMVAGESLIVALVAGALGVALGGPLAELIVNLLEENGPIKGGFELGSPLLPAACALGLGIAVAQGAVIVAGRRAGRIKPAEALREAAVEHAAPGKIQVLAGATCLAGGAAMALIFDGQSARAFSILTGLLLAMGVGLLGRLLLGLPAAALGLTLRGFGASGALAGSSLTANRWRTAALATPIVLVVMMAGTQGIVAATDRDYVEDTSAARVDADWVVTGSEGAPLPRDTQDEISALTGVEAVTGTLPTQVFGLSGGVGEGSPWPAAGVNIVGEGLDLKTESGDLDVGGLTVGVSHVFAGSADLEVGDTFEAVLSDGKEQELRVGGVFARAAGLGDVIMAEETARRHTPSPQGSAIFVSGNSGDLRGYVEERPWLQLLDRSDYLKALETENQRDTWGIWLIIGLAIVFTALALVNTAAMATTERRGELATIRLLGGTRGHALRMVLLEMGSTVAAALAVGGVVVFVALTGVSKGLTAEPLSIPLDLVAGLLGGAMVLGALACAVSAFIALRTSPALATRTRE